MQTTNIWQEVVNLSFILTRFYNILNAKSQRMFWAVVKSGSHHQKRDRYFHPGAMLSTTTREILTITDKFTYTHVNLNSGSSTT